MIRTIVLISALLLQGCATVARDFIVRDTAVVVESVHFARGKCYKVNYNLNCIKDFARIHLRGEARIEPSDAEILFSATRPSDYLAWNEAMEYALQACGRSDDTHCIRDSARKHLEFLYGINDGDA